MVSAIVVCRHVDVFLRITHSNLGLENNLNLCGCNIGLHVNFAKCEFSCFVGPN